MGSTRLSRTQAVGGLIFYMLLPRRRVLWLNITFDIARRFVGIGVDSMDVTIKVQIGGQVDTERRYREPGLALSRGF